jgi:hypothetical protein
MAYPTNRRKVPIKKEYTLNVDKFMGINISANSTQITKEESPDVINMLSDDKGALDGRKGWITLFDSLGVGSINCLLKYDKSTGPIYIFAFGTKLYSIDDITIEPLTYTEIFDGVEDVTIRGFNFNDNLYIQDGVSYLVYDGTTVEDVVGYIPIRTTDTPPSGGGTVLEDFNLIQAGFTQLFTGDGVSTTYVLVLQDLDATIVEIDISGVTLTEGTEFTVDRTLGTIDFSAGSAPHGAPTDPTPTSTNNVTITAFKTIAGRDILIRNTTINAVWGATEGNRVFLSGNINFKNNDYRSGLLDATYFPDTGIVIVGNANNAIESYSFLYNRLVIIKEKSIYTREYIDNGGNPLFGHEKLNGAIGSSGHDATDQLNNFPTFVTEKGVFQVTSIDPFNERNVRNVSEKIDRNIEFNSLAVLGILELGELDTYISIDFDKKYWLLHPTLDFSWVYDYDESSPTFGAWYRLDDFKANCILEINGAMYWGRSDKGTICRFKDFNTDGDINSDDNEGEVEVIEKRWTSKLFSYNTTTNLKLIRSVFVALKQGNNVSADLYSRNDRRQNWKLWTTFTASLFDYSTVSYSTWTYEAGDFPNLYKKKVKQKKVGYYQIKIESLTESTALGMLSVDFTFLVQREVR